MESRPPTPDHFAVVCGGDVHRQQGLHLLDEFRLAQRVSRLSSSRLYRMVTEDAARILRLENGEGTIVEGGVADLLVVRNNGKNPAEMLRRLRTGGMELVVVGGRIKLVSPRLATQLPIGFRKRLRPMTVEERRMVFLDVDLPKIYRQASRVLGPEIRVAGKEIRVGGFTVSISV